MLALGRAGDPSRLAQQFREAQPFPHLVLHDLLALDPASVASFPDPEWPHWERLTDAYQEGKSWCRDLERMPEPWSGVIRELTEPRFLRFLESVSGIAKLIPDPYLEGGGLHLSGPRGHLAPHTDYHVYGGLDLFRRLNVLVYLNPEWEDGDGGSLGLYAESDREPAVRVEPRFGTCVIFETSDVSIHGVERVAEGRLRRSVALYYYTAADSARYAGDHSTHWRVHPVDGAVSRVRVATYSALMRISRLFSMAAHLASPHFGLRAVRERLEERKREAD